jgi:hypothetical protein
MPILLYIRLRIFSYYYQFVLYLATPSVVQNVRRRMVDLYISNDIVKYGHDSRGTGSQEWPCWRGPAAIYRAD